MCSHHNCFAEKLICSHNYTTFTTAAVPRSVQTFLLVHYFSIQCLCLGRVLVLAGNSAVCWPPLPISNIIISDKREAKEQFYWRDLTSESLVTIPPLFTILNIPNQEFSHNENSYNTIQGLWPDTAWTPVISQESRKCGPEGNISNGNPAVKFQFSNLSSILSIEVKFNLAKWMDYVILTSIYQIPDIGQNWTLFLPRLLQVTLQLKVDRRRFLLILKHY